MMLPSNEQRGTVMKVIFNIFIYTNNTIKLFYYANIYYQ